MSLALAFGTLALFACSDQSPIEPPAVTPEFSNSSVAKALATVGWQEQARLLVAANKVSPTAATRVYAVLSVAQYAAVDLADRRTGDGERSRHGYGQGGRRRFEAERGAVAGASLVVLKFFFPTAADALALRVQQETQAASHHPHFARGLAAGTQMGEKLVTWARNDHTADPWLGTVPVGPGLWRNSGPPVAPMLGNATAYFLTSGDQFRPPAPPAFGSTAFLTDLEEIRTLSATRTPQQLASAQFWNMSTGTMTSSGYWNQLASTYIVKYRLNERAATHVFALLHSAMFDAVIGCWDAKYFYWMIRPSQVDGSVPAITLPIGLPNHPSYPGGHSCNSAAAITVLGHFFPKHMEELDDQMVQAGLSRMYGGIHYRFDITAGQDLGKSVAHLAIRIDRRRGLLSTLR